MQLGERMTIGLAGTGAAGMAQVHARMTARERERAELHRPVEELAAGLETRTAEREAALGEMLQVINSSPGNLAQVFDAMLKKRSRAAPRPPAGCWSAAEKRLGMPPVQPFPSIGERRGGRVAAEEDKR